MRPQDIDKIANLVVGSLSGAPGAGLLGCGAVSSGQAYDPLCNDPSIFVCTPVESFECGGEARFSCCAGFECTTDFYCPGPNLFACLNQQQFICPTTFVCGAQDSFEPTSSYCGTPPV